MKNTIYYLCLFVGISMNSFAQEKSAREEKGDKFYFIYAFDKAVDLYTRTKTLTTSGQRNLADSYKNLGKLTDSETEYVKLVNQTNGVLPKDYYNYAMLLKSLGKYNESNNWMDKYVGLKPNDLIAKSYTLNKNNLTKLQTSNESFKLLKLDANTDDKDFATVYFNEKIVFASSRTKAKMIKRKNNRNGNPYLNLYVADVENRQFKNVQNLSKKLNYKFNDGPASFAKNGTLMAITRNKSHDKSKDKIVELQIYLSTLKDGKWSKEEPFIMNNEGYSVGHPCLSEDGKTMYFTSDMPGGYGGTDIYKATANDQGVWSSTIENLGDKINTEGNELFPFVGENKKTLYFTSDGHFGLGGLDVFSTPISNGFIGTITNLGHPINTKYDDLSFILDKKNIAGYFSSNREGGVGDDDVYAFDYLEKTKIQKRIEGTAMNESGNFIPAAKIQLLDEKEVLLSTITASDSGKYSFKVETDKNFKLVGSKKDYMDGQKITNSFAEDSIIYADLMLMQDKSKETKVGDDLAKKNNFNPKSIYFDFDQTVIRQDAEKELNKIVAIMNEYPTMEVEFRSYTDCRASKEYNQTLSNYRAVATANYIKSRISKPERIYGKGYGESKLVNNCACEDEVTSDCPDSEHEKNRRSEFVVIKK
jgi:outer membrane protein OmpA-like peptidoglycan-associated protein